MARGWESKSVEAQMESFATERGRSAQSRPSPEQIESARRKTGLLMARSRALQDLERSEHPRRREMLIRAIADLDEQLALLQ
jgi:hypothetical protein